jgi:hypothetical protein
VQIARLLDAVGGDGGGGRGFTYSPGGASGVAGTTNTGSGGGGGASAADGGNGGSGVVIISYANTYSDISTIDVGLTYTKTTPTGYKVYTFTAGTGAVTF